MAAGGIGEGGSLGTALDHMQHIESGHHSVAEKIALAHGAEQWPLFVTGDSGRCNPGVQVLFEGRMTGHFMALTAFFMQSQPPAFTMLKIVADLHADGGTDPGEAVDHCANQRPVTQSN
jgi:hypothetical protein